MVGLIADYTGVPTGKNDVGVLVTVGGWRGACDVPSGAVNHHGARSSSRGGHADCGSGFGLCLIMRKGCAVLHVGQRLGDFVRVDSGSDLRQLA